MSEQHYHLRATKYFKGNNAIVFGILWMLLFVWIWSMGAASYIPTPTQVFQAFPRVWNERGLGGNLFDSLELNLQAVSVMFVLAYFIAVATTFPGIWGKIFRPLSVLVSSGRFNGMVGLPLIFTSMFHNAHKVKIALLVFGMGVFTVLSLAKMFQNVSKDLFDHARTLRMNEWHVVWEVVVLGTFDQVIDILRINMAMGWMMLPIIEGRFKFEGGVGAMMEVDAKQFDYPAVFAVIIVILLVGLGQDGLIALFKRIVSPYAKLGLERA
jgi:NitT/TauT family transport system permease protein